MAYARNSTAQYDVQIHGLVDAFGGFMVEPTHLQSTFHKFSSSVRGISYFASPVAHFRPRYYEFDSQNLTSCFTLDQICHQWAQWPFFWNAIPIIVAGQAHIIIQHSIHVRDYSSPSLFLTFRYHTFFYRALPVFGGVSSLGSESILRIGFN